MLLATPSRRTCPHPAPLLSLTLLLLSAIAFSGCAVLTGTVAPTSTPTPTSVPIDGEPTPPPASPVESNGGSLLGLPSIAALVDRVEPAVVNIVTETVQQTSFGAQRGVGSGSGVIFLEDGYILTNNHVVDGASNIRVTLSDTRQYPATIVGVDATTDLAVVRIKEKGLPTLPFGDAARLRVGDWVVAIGNAAGLKGKPTVTLGIVSALDRSLQTGDVTLTDLIQTDAVINPGNSGGPLLNLQGEVVGINSVVLRGTQFEGIGFAISTDTARLVADQLVRNGRVIWPRMGVFIADIDQPTAAELALSVREGVLITGTETGGPAAVAGLRANDVIVAVAGKPTPNVKALQILLRSEFQVGQKIKVSVARGKTTQDFTLTLAESQR
ncbi:MAG: trypsin-like peptidase domain-containing protein [Chloroflexi bacterium]|nr:trypsin-like peptidase domain-containing protein [Chloroflexota bacterium]